MREKLIRATELAEFVYCSKAWELKYQDGAEVSPEACELQAAANAWHIERGRSLARGDTGSKAEGIERDCFATVRSVDARTNTLNIELEDGSSVTYDPQRNFENCQRTGVVGLSSGRYRDKAPPRTSRPTFTAIAWLNARAYACKPVPVPRQM